ncbi:hypothetical protein PsYK624_012560 [Phanerochaete sordida]|uniref:Transmembrane protein n=1 Tax=Phanerochaete sordida TaxID=48140 RepID=A0A9P3FYZ9_9APHY|nr:hypothetical protein PsYK624_012560 [Phanerochaete sordida]
MLTTTSGTGSSTSPGVLYEISSTDPSLVYAGDWHSGDMSADAGQTAQGTKSAGANVTFIFEGTLVSAFGTIDTSGISCTWSLDGDGPHIVDQPGQPSTQYRFPIFSQQVPSANHTLVIVSTSSERMLWLDYLTYTGTKFIPPKAAVASPSSSSTASYSGVSTTKSVPSWAIAIAAIGAIAFVALAVTGAVLLVRRRHRLRLERPRSYATIHERTFEIIPTDKPKESSISDVLRVKFTGALRSSSRTAPGAATQVPLSSTVFTSVIMGPSTVATS